MPTSINKDYGFKANAQFGNAEMDYKYVHGTGGNAAESILMLDLPWAHSIVEDQNIVSIKFYGEQERMAFVELCREVIKANEEYQKG